MSHSFPEETQHTTERDLSATAARALWPRSLAVVETKRVMRKATIYFALRLMLPTQKLAKVNEGKRLPSPGTSQGGVKSVRNHCSFPLDALFGQRWTGRVMRRVAPAPKITALLRLPNVKVRGGAFLRRPS